MKGKYVIVNDRSPLMSVEPCLPAPGAARSPRLCPNKCSREQSCITVVLHVFTCLIPVVMETMKLLIVTGW